MEIHRKWFEEAVEMSCQLLKSKIARIASHYMASELAHDGRRFRSGATVAS